MKILVSGAAGFIGSNLVERLLDDCHFVIGADNLVTGRMTNLQVFAKNKMFDFSEGDLCNGAFCRKIMKDVDIVFHEAALGSVPRSVEKPIDTHRNNTESTLNLLIAATESRVTRFIYASSASVYGNQYKDDIALEENMLTGPINPYAVSKLCCEEYVKSWFELYGLPTVSLRYFNVFGPKQDPNSQYSAAVPKLIHQAFAKTPLTIHGNGKQFRDFTHVQNVVHANLKAMEASEKACGKAFNIACGRTTTLNELACMISSSVDIENQIEYTKPRLGDVKGNVANITRAKDVLDYEPLLDVKEGIKQTVAWYKAQYENNI